MPTTRANKVHTPSEGLVNEPTAIFWLKLEEKRKMENREKMEQNPTTEGERVNMLDSAWERVSLYIKEEKKEPYERETRGTVEEL